MTRILLAVDSEILRPPLQEILSELPGVEAVHDVADLDRVEAEVREFKPDIVILSLIKLGQTSIRLAPLLRAENPNLLLVALAGPFTFRDEAAWHSEGIDCALNIGMGDKKLIDYVSNYIAFNSANDQIPAEHTGSVSRGSFAGSINRSLLDGSGQSQSTKSFHAPKESPREK